MYCKHCGAKGDHYCTVKSKHMNSDLDIDNFVISAIVGAATNPIVGGLVGGSFLGGIVGDMLGGDD